MQTYSILTPLWFSKEHAIVGSWMLVIITIINMPVPLVNNHFFFAGAAAAFASGFAAPPAAFASPFAASPFGASPLAAPP